MPYFLILCMASVLHFAAGRLGNENIFAARVSKLFPWGSVCPMPVHFVAAALH